mgnify:FL=1
MTSLSNPFQLGDLTLSNRIVMAPMTRCRAGAGDVPTASMLTYYQQRASAGLIITEATNVSPMSVPFEKAPGIYSDEQTAGWRPVADAVHAAGGRIFCQLWHGGRVGAQGLLEGRQPLAPSEVNDDLDALQVWALLANGRYVRIAATPSRALESAEVEEIVQQYRQAAANAWAAGFDGVEVHAANGYLPHQFLSPTTNRRTDRYGGAPENRARFLQEIVENIAEVMPIDRVGVRLSPTAGYNSPRDPDPAETYGWVAAMLQRQGVAFIEIADTNAWAGKPDRDELLRMIGPHFNGPLILNGGLTPDKAAELVSEGSIDLASFARQFIANPDLPARIEAGGPFNEPRHVGWYGGGDEGYTDYQPLENPAARDR